MPRNKRDFDPEDARVIACARAKEKAGGYPKLARAIGVTPEAVFQWKIVPVERCQEVARLTAMSVHEMRPDIFGFMPTRVAG